MNPQSGNFEQGADLTSQGCSTLTLNPFQLEFDNMVGQGHQAWAELCPYLGDQNQRVSAEELFSKDVQPYDYNKPAANIALQCCDSFATQPKAQQIAGLTDEKFFNQMVNRAA